MAKVLFLSFLLSVLLSFHVALGDSGWVIGPYGMDHVCRLTQDYASADLCRILMRIRFGHALSEFPSARIKECSIISLKMVLKPKIGVHVLVATDILVEFGPFLNMRVEVTFRLALQIGRHRLFVQDCTVVDAVIKGRSMLATDGILHTALDALVRVITNPINDRARTWCRDLNYCFDFVQYPFPITPSCYAIWKNQFPRISENQIELRSQPVCTCKEMEEGISVSVDSIIAFRTAIPPMDQSIYFCHEKDATYFFECMRRGGMFNDLLILISMTVGSIGERLPSLALSCPRSANIVLKIENTRIHVDMQLNLALLCFRLRVNVGCDKLNFTSALTFTVNGCFNLFFDVDCRRELLLLSVSARSPLQIRSRCPEGEECELDEGLLAEAFLEPLTAWSVSHINAKLKNGIRIPFLKHYPCDNCQKTIYVPRRVYCPCTLSFVRK